MSACPHDPCDTEGLTQGNVPNQRQDAQEQKREELLDKLADLIGQAKDDADLKQIERYLDELDPDPEPFDAQRSLEEFHRKHDTSFALEPAKRQKKPAYLRRTALIAIIAVLCVTFVAAAQAGGLHILDILARWTGAEFQFQRETGAEEVTNPSITQQYDSLQDVLSAYGVTTPLAPKTYPTDSRLLEIQLEIESGKMMFYASYQIPAGFLYITIRAIGVSRFSNVETNEREMETYIAGGIEHHILEDVALLKAEWYNGNWECRISGTITYEDLIAMIDSIYE